MLSEIIGVEKVLERLTLKRAIIDKSNLWVPMFNVSNMTPIFIAPVGARAEKEMTGSLISYPQIRQNYILRGSVFVEKAHHFWQMIWEKESLFIVMLTSPVNQAQIYFPANEKERLVFGPFAITCTRRDATRGYITRVLTVKKQDNKVLHTVTHIQYVSWGFYTPVPERFGQFLDHLKHHNALWNASISRYSPTCGMHAPVIQSNSGLGRTGCLVIINVISRMLEYKVKHKYNIEKMVLGLKNGLPNGIESIAEYKFIVNQVIWETEKLKPEYVLGRQHLHMVSGMVHYNYSSRNVEKLMCSKKWMPVGASLDYECFRKAVNVEPEYENFFSSENYLTLH
ncbi:hypothetical protein GCK72_025128 [Caenorhabditis remanei]|uniref:Tyrosine-protein phosphatase domain-containing protein n=1 Tax=Caenorhabditis remanei TaxID=31234 RepID=A0A6A5G1L9_CAERE|nr:hypothetical protein GCK72_025128 [Caenorhabditis remanei]KAF1748661.1 hypothetical protein GCK72_025128 [Caenorhabditis remanei]